ncbi:aldose 1-epimerase [Thioclava sp. ES.031]|uniref:aldose epimerase family protein n=1 Tax=Thioclava sp. ES.031 TaxID=1798203 RepID=UPI000C01D734|nr:aldose epimerase family protein [Thioclava sp. ES.031]PFG61778.1 aldose 1-epimerase [Thioclava sp. ES.031]
MFDHETELEIGLASGMLVRIDPKGARLTSLALPGPSGPVELLIGPDPVQTTRSFHGATIGRYANRIAGAKFTLDGEQFQLDANENGNCLHGGGQGFDQCDWKVVAHWINAATLQLESPDGDQGFPGNLVAEVSFAVSDPATLNITYRARCDRACPVSLTSHGYFNLAGGGSIADHQLKLNADQVLEIDAETLPVGAPRDVAGTRFDFREPAPVPGPDGAGFDHNFCLRPGAMREVAVLSDPTSGRSMTMLSNQPGLQVYTAPSGDSFNAICLEPQAWPDAPNHPEFPSAILRPGVEYVNRIRLQFSG